MGRRAPSGKGDKAVNPKAWDGPATDGNPNHCSDGVDQDCSGVDGDSVGTNGASCSCVPGDVEACAQTEKGVPISFPGGKPAPGSVCTFGSRTCAKDPTTGGGSWGPCGGAIGPGTEVCNNKDDDCDGATDEEDASGKLDWAYDGDADGYRATKKDGTEFATRAACAKPVGTPPECDATYCGSVAPATCCPPDRWRLANTASNKDCDDRDSKVNPAAPEVCANGTTNKDDNCNGKTDELPAVGSELWFYDGDGDGYGDKAIPPQVSCAAPGVGWKKGIPNTDCNDKVGTTNPGVAEDCGTPQDDNCNNTAKDTCGCLVGTDPPVDCGTPNDCVYIAKGSTCVAGVYSACPARVEKRSYCPDGDKDGSCNRAACIDACPTGTATAGSTAASQPDGFVPRGDCPVVSDCDDADEKRTPGKAELCGSYDNNIDADCDGAPDNGFDLGMACNVTDLAIGACKGGGTRTCAGPQSVTCSSPSAKPPAEPYEPTIPSMTYHTTPASNGSFDWNCDNSTSKIQGFYSFISSGTSDYCIQTVAVPDIIQGTPPTPAPWTDKACLHPTPDGVRYKLPVCGDFSKTNCNVYNYFTSCNDIDTSGPFTLGSYYTCDQPCGKPVSRLGCKWDASASKCVSTSLVSGSYYVGCY